MYQRAMSSGLFLKAPHPKALSTRVVYPLFAAIVSCVRIFSFVPVLKSNFAVEGFPRGPIVPLAPPPVSWFLVVCGRGEHIYFKRFVEEGISIPGISYHGDVWCKNSSCFRDSI